jgi:DNA helicase IV
MNQGDIAEKILIQRKGEIEQKVPTRAVGCVNVNARFAYKTFWLFNEELRLNPNIATRDQRYVSNPFDEIGIAKNSRMGAFLIQRKNGSYNVGNNKEVYFEITNFTSYDPVSDDKYALNLRIEIFGIGKFTFNSLIEFIDYNDRKVINPPIAPIVIDPKIESKELKNKPVKLEQIKNSDDSKESKELVNITINLNQDKNISTFKFRIDLTQRLQDQINKGVQINRKFLLKSEYVSISINEFCYYHSVGFKSNYSEDLVHEAYVAVKRTLLIHFANEDDEITHPRILGLLGMKGPLLKTDALIRAVNDENIKKLAQKINKDFNYLVSIYEIANNPKKVLEKIKDLNEEELNKIKELEGISHYIRSNNEMRMQHILDEIQDDIKRSRIFNGVLVIEGGPGTGKTTTLIQRIKFLIDNTIVEYEDKYKDILPFLQGESGWMFFSPSKLLLGYLRNSMIQEGLLASDATSKVWGNYLNEVLLRDYSLIGDKAPFKLYIRPIGSILPNDDKFLTNLIEDFKIKILDYFNENIEKYVNVISKLSISKVYISNSDKEKMVFINEVKELYGCQNLYTLINRLDRFKEKYKKNYINKICNELIDKYTIAIIYLLKQKNSYARFYELLKSNTILNQIAISNNEQEDEIIESELSKESQFIQDKELVLGVRKLLWVLALEKIGVPVNTKFNDLAKSIINELCTDLDLNDLGEKINFLTNIRILNSGSARLIIDKIPSFYSKYRAELLTKLEHLDDKTYFENLNTVIKEGNQLHYDERNYLILFINTTIRTLQKSNAVVFKEGHNYITSYKLYQRYIVAIDEASDFSLIELACMHSFSHPDYNSTSLSGDIMQRLSKNGIQNWSSFIDFVGEGDIKALNISYRQSVTLCNLAKAFYFKVTGIKAEYSTNTTISLHEPKPEVKQLTCLKGKVTWISDKILEIFATYGNKYPSIAIFVPDDSSVLELTNALNIDKLGQEGISVESILKNGTTISRSQINVYNIETIKGLEFETVFFVDIDLIELNDPDLLKKYLYVGISRAAYYLYVTYQNSLPKELDILEAYF